MSLKDLKIEIGYRSDENCFVEDFLFPVLKDSKIEVIPNGFSLSDFVEENCVGSDNSLLTLGLTNS